MLPNRVGFHYFPDSLHYGEKHLEMWLPKLKDLDAGWIVLQSPINRAIPEAFIVELAKAQIQVILDFNYPNDASLAWDDLDILLKSYGKWGAGFALLNQRPNMQSSWGAHFWSSSDLVAQHIAQFQIFAKQALDCGIKPIFSPLVPSGDYWDLSFLNNALMMLSKVDSPNLINNLVLSAFAWTFGRSLDWGTGGSRRWSAVKAYHIPEYSQDQSGFRAFEWYLECSRQVLGKALPVILFQAGILNDSDLSAAEKPLVESTEILKIFSLLNDENVHDSLDSSQLLSSIPPEVLACNFFTLSTDDPRWLSHAWFSPQGHPAEIAQLIQTKYQPPHQSQPVMRDRTVDSSRKSENSAFRYGRYILLSPSLQPHVSEILQTLHAYISNHKPLIGYSREEACQAAYILAVGSESDFSEQDLQYLQQRGSLIQIVTPDRLDAIR